MSTCTAVQHLVPALPGSNIVVCLCVFIYAVAKKPDPPIPDIKKPDQVQLTVIGLKLLLLFTKEQ